jgi:hypothetical protein
LKFQFDYTGLYCDTLANWGVRTVEVEGQRRRCGQQTMRLHGRVRSGTAEIGDLVAVPTKSGGVFLAEVVDYMVSLTEWGDLGWYSGVAQVPYKFWLVLRGVPAARDIACPGVGIGQDKHT